MSSLTLAGKPVRAIEWMMEQMDIDKNSHLGEISIWKRWIVGQEKRPMR